VKIIDIISPERVLATLKSTDKQGILSELAEHLVACDPELAASDLDAVLRVLSERERLASTGISDGVAIPHGKLSKISKVSACLAIKREGVDFSAIDGGLSQIFIVLLAPESSASLHLKALARISRLFKGADFRQAILEAEGAQKIYRVLAEEDARQ